MKSLMALWGAPQATLSPENDLWGHAAVRALADQEAPPAESHARPVTNHDFSQVPAQATGPDGKHTAVSCPQSPRRCPFGGACHTCPTRVQAKLAISQPGDDYEREADRVAETVMRLPAPAAPVRAAGGVPGPAGLEAAPLVQEVLHTPGQPLEAGVRAFMEPRFGYDFSQVRVHTDERAAQSAEAMQALAFTVGNHIALDTRRLLPNSIGSRPLIAHELAHVVQQSPGHTSPQPASGRTVPVAAKAPLSLQRQGRSGQRPSPQPTRPNAPQQRLVDAARRAAAIRCQIAMFRVRGIDPVADWGRRAHSLAQVMFAWDDPNMDQVGDVISAMVTYLTSDLQVIIAPANDPECGSRAAYVRGLRPPVVLCPAFFTETPEQQTRTLIHEAAHLARIGSAGLGESYCVDFDCAASCGGFDSADSWAHFVHCLSGQAPDQPMTIRGRTPPGRTGQPSQHPSGSQP